MSAIKIAQEYKTFTVEEIFNALEKNGLEHLRQEWVSVKDDKVVGGCALGQAAYNLSVPYNEDTAGTDNLYDELAAFGVSDSSKWVTEGVYTYWGYNPDDTEWIPSVADVIIYWNDKRKKDENGDMFNPDHTPIYEIGTYAEVVEIAREVMTPFFAQTIQLPHYEY